VSASTKGKTGHPAQQTSKRKVSPHRPMFICPQICALLKDRLAYPPFGYSRDRKRGKRTDSVGLLTSREGCPVAIELFSGDVRDRQALAAQLDRLRVEFGLSEVVVEDRGLITRVHGEALDRHGYGWISARRAPRITKLHPQVVLQLSLFDEENIAEI